jgi:hypothetical protein
MAYSILGKPLCRYFKSIIMINQRRKENDALLKTMRDEVPYTGAVKTLGLTCNLIEFIITQCLTGFYIKLTRYQGVRSWIEGV